MIKTTLNCREIPRQTFTEAEARGDARRIANAAILAY